MPDFTIKKGDSAPPIKAQLLTDEGDPVNLSKVHQVHFEMSCNATEISGTCRITDRESGRVEYQWSRGDTDVARDYSGHFIVEYRDGRKLTVPNDSDLKIRVK